MSTRSHVALRSAGSTAADLIGGRMIKRMQALRSRLSFTQLAIAGVILITVAAIASVALRQFAHTESPTARDFAFKKGDPDSGPGEHKRALVGPNDARWPDYSPEVEAYLLRAYPEAEVPGEATLAARNGWATLNASAHSAGAWQLIGPSKATYPAVLNPFLFDGAQYVAAGRVTAMAIGPSCRPGACPLFVGAAGGGIWKTRDALAGNLNWQFVSGSFATNAIGSLQ